MHKALIIGVLVLTLFICWGLTVNPPEEVLKQMEPGSPPVYAPQPTFSPPVEAPTPQLTATPKSPAPTPESTVKEELKPKETPKAGIKIPYLKILIIAGIIILLGIIGYIIYQKSLPEF